MADGDDKYKIFGGRDVILFGDFLQLSPVKEKPCKKIPISWNSHMNKPHTTIDFIYNNKEITCTYDAKKTSNFSLLGMPPSDGRSRDALPA